MRARTNTKLLCEGPVNLFLLCTVVSKQTRRLARLVPEERTAELISIALRNCADHEFEIQVDGNTPDVIREAAARMFPPARIANATNAVSAIGGQQATEGRQNPESPLFTKFQRVFTFLGAMVLILLILVAIYITVRGNIQ